MKVARLRQGVTVCFAAAFSVFILLSVGRLAPGYPTSKVPAHRGSASVHGDGKLGAVSTESALCSEIGLQLLREGGNAADALVGSTFCVGVVGMAHSGIGGGGFMLIRSSTGSYEFIDFRESAPAAATERMYKHRINESLFGGLSSGVPGEVRGLEYLHKTYGCLPWTKVMRPAIDIARNGFRVTEDQANLMSRALTEFPRHNFFVEDPAWAVDFAPHGKQVALNDSMTRKRYANTLEKIAEEGPDAFYHGPIAESTIAAVQKANGTMTMQDLEDYAIVVREPVEVSYRDFRIISCGAPSSGAVVLSAMKTVEGYSGFGEPKEINLTTHRLSEAMRFAYAERASLGDPSYLPGLDIYQSGMLNETSANNIRHRISDLHTLNVSAYNPQGWESLETHGTSGIVASDSNGLAIALTTTVNLLFGSQLMVPETGIIMNDEMADFSVPNASNVFGYVPSPSNFIRPGKRSLSSIANTIVEHRSNSSLYFLTAAAGGSKIITAIIQALWNVLDRGDDCATALRRPRFHDQLVPNIIGFEKSYDRDTVEFMKGRGHNATWLPWAGSAAYVIRLHPNGTFEAAAEPRYLNSGGLVT